MMSGFMFRRSGLVRMLPSLMLCSALFVVSGCATVDKITGKSDLEQANLQLRQQSEEQKSSFSSKVAELTTQIQACKKELEKVNAEHAQQLDQLKITHEQEKADIRKEMEEQKRKFAALEADFQKEIEREKYRSSFIKVIFFGGDIIYEVANDAFNDYRAGLRFKTLRDADFASQYKLFEVGKGGDPQVLSVLKEIDVSKDRIIDAQEARAFRKNEETIFNNSTTAAAAK
jgi:vacuolar-type H+-ATPase subunit I/STV1